MTLRSVLFVTLPLVVAITLPETAASQADRETGPSTGRRHLIEQAERERQQRQRWEIEEAELRRRARVRQRQREDFIEQIRQGEAAQTPQVPDDSARVP